MALSLYSFFVRYIYRDAIFILHSNKKTEEETTNYQQVSNHLVIDSYRIDSGHNIELYDLYDALVTGFQ